MMLPNYSSEGAENSPWQNPFQAYGQPPANTPAAPPTPGAPTGPQGNTSGQFVPDGKGGFVPLAQWLYGSGSSAPPNLSNSVNIGSFSGPPEMYNLMMQIQSQFQTPGQAQMPGGPMIPNQSRAGMGSPFGNPAYGPANPLTSPANPAAKGAAPFSPQAAPKRPHPQTNWGY